MSTGNGMNSIARTDVTETSVKTHLALLVNKCLQHLRKLLPFIRSRPQKQPYCLPHACDAPIDRGTFVR
jgi:hypothetical protein